MSWHVPDLPKWLKVGRGYFRNWGQHPEDTKNGTSSLKRIKKGKLNLTSPYCDGLFIIVLTKQVFEKISYQGQRPEVALSSNLK